MSEAGQEYRSLHTCNRRTAVRICISLFLGYKSNQLPITISAASAPKLCQADALEQPRLSDSIFICLEMFARASSLISVGFPEECFRVTETARLSSVIVLNF